MNEPGLVTDPAPATRVPAPMPCLRCRYEVGGMAADQRCPECGTEIATTSASIAGAGSTTLTHLRRGLGRIGIAMIGGILWLVLGQMFVLYVAMSGMWFMDIGPSIYALMHLTVGVISCTFTLLSLFGWSAAMRGVEQVYPARAKRAAAIRALSRIYTAMYIGSGIGIAAVTTLSFESDLSEICMSALVAATMLLWSVRTALGFGLLNELCASLGAVATSRCMRMATWGAIALPVILIGLTIGGVLLELGTIAGMHPELVMSIIAFSLTAAIIVLGSTAFILRGKLRLFWRAARAREQAQTAA